jgi:hypothetical protein
MKKYICSAIFLFGSFSSPAEFIFSPNGGVLDFQSGIPFFTTSSQTPGVRYQQIYGSGDFLSHGASQYLITELAFGVSGGDLVTLSNMQINLSTSAKVPDGLSSTFGENVGPDDAVVYSGRLPVDGVGTSFNFHIPLQHPFLYDANAGSLLLDVRNFRTIAFSGTFSLMDGANSSLDRISSAASFNVNSPTAGLFVNTSGLATRFTVTPVAEPSAVLMIALGLVAFVGWRWKLNLRNKSSGS